MKGERNRVVLIVGFSTSTPFFNFVFQASDHRCRDAGNIKGFRGLKAHKQLPLLRTALLKRQAKFASTHRVAQNAEAS
jgi:hypothetical protein